MSSDPLSPKMCRSLLIETINISDNCLALIGKSLSETIKVAINRVTERTTITHLIAYLVDIQAVQISELLAIKSSQFSTERLWKLSHLKRQPMKQLMINRNTCEIVAILLKDIEESINKSKDLKKTELTYVSGRDVEEVVDDFIYAFDAQQMDTSFLSQINILIIKSSADPSVAFGPNSMNFTGISKDLRSLLSVQTIDESENSIDGYFKVWLHELSIKSEKVRIYLNSRTAQHKERGSDVIECDLREAIIDLNRLSIDKSGKKMNSSQIQALESLPNICETNRCYDLQLLGLISRLGLCESVLFGIPYILSATRSPNLELNELKHNCQRFKALIEVMKERNAVLVLELRQQNNQNKNLKTLFAVMSSPDDNQLVMKAIASKELVLPNITDPLDTMASKTPPKSVKDSIKERLNDFPFADVYNPLFIETNLFNIL